MVRQNDHATHEMPISEPPFGGVDLNARLPISGNQHIMFFECRLKPLRARHSSFRGVLLAALETVRRL
jgi:hypothetical protein